MPGDEEQDARITSIRNSLNRTRGYLRSAIHNAEATLGQLEADFENRASQIMEESLRTLLDKVEGQWAKYTARFEEYEECDLPKKAEEDAKIAFGLNNTAYNKARNDLIVALAKIETARESRYTGGGGGAGPGMVPKIQTIFKPDKLSSDATVTDFKMWKEMYESFHEMSQLDKFPVKVI